MYAGPGSAPMLAAAAAWDGLVEELYMTAASYGAVISGLTNDGWLGPSSASMGATATHYVAWMPVLPGKLSRPPTRPGQRWWPTRRRLR